MDSLSISGFLPGGADLRSSRSQPSALLQAITGRRVTRLPAQVVPWKHSLAQASVPQRDPSDVPAWLKVGERVGYVSRSTRRVLEVVVEKVSRLRREVTITFAEDRSTWKCLPFSLVVSRESPLVPLPSKAGGTAAAAATVEPSGSPSGAAAPPDDKGDLPRRVQPAETQKGEGLRRAPAKAPPAAAALVGGVAVKAIPDTAITASSYFMNNPRHGLGQMWRTRIDSADTAWRAAADDAAQCVRWNFGGLRRIVKIQTKGSLMDPYWVKQYQVSHSTDGSSWTRLDHTFTANEDQDSLAENDLAPPVVAQFLRLHPVSWHEHISLRAELLGFEVEEAVPPKVTAGEAGAAPVERCRSRSRSPARKS